MSAPQLSVTSARAPVSPLSSIAQTPTSTPSTTSSTIRSRKSPANLGPSPPTAAGLPETGPPAGGSLSPPGFTGGGGAGAAGARAVAGAGSEACGGTSAVVVAPTGTARADVMAGRA